VIGRPRINSFLFALLSFISSVFFLSSNAFAQSDHDFEVYLEFRHRGIINSVVVSYYDNDEFFLPIGEIFNLFQIENKIDGLVIEGNFSIDQIPYSINFQRQRITFGDKVYDLEAADFRLKELDSYLPPRIFSEVFDLNFSVDFNSLALQLETQAELPLIERALRNQQRRTDVAFLDEEEFYDLKEERDYRLLRGGFADYSVSSSVVNSEPIFNYNTAIGVEALFGDLQGSIFGVYADENLLTSTNNLRLRYMFDNPYASRIIIGQSNLNGVLKNPYRGIRISNEPIEPRRLFDEFEVEGTTFPQSEVELYLNNALVDYQQADELGNYRFLTPLFYGSTQLDLRIYGPTGQVAERTSRIQVPFNFTPQGRLDYSINSGVLDNPLIGSTKRNFVTQASASYGVTSWLTSKFGVEYYDLNQTDNRPSLTTTLSSRLFSNYILSVEGVTDGYYRGTLSAIYPNAASFNVDYISYVNEFGIYNSSGNDEQLLASVFLPFRVGNFPLNIRSSTFTRFRNNISFSTFGFDLISRLRKFSFRVGLSDQLIDQFNPFDLSPSARIESSATYNFSRNPNVPLIFRGTFLRGQFRFLPNANEFQSAEILFSRNVFNTGRVQLAIGRNFPGEYTTLRFNLVLDFNRFRSNTTATVLNDGYSITQNVRGSIGYDPNYNNFLFSSRNQVGRSGTAFKMYVDNNNNDSYDIEIDDDIEGAGVRIGRSGSSSIYKNGILYYTQMLPYFRYNIEMNTSGIRNPMLVPNLNNFSIITDPNNFKKVEVPFYMAGVMEGGVQQVYPDSSQRGIGGLKVLLSDASGEVIKELRTFSDGSFYEYPLPPGPYTLTIDKSQLDILQVDSEPAKIDFDVQAVRNGDFVEGLSFLLVPRRTEEESEEAEQQRITIAQVTDEIRTSPEILEYSQQIFVTIDEALRFLIEAQNTFYSKNIDVAFALVSESLEFFETAQGHALKGSFYYFKGNIEQAQRHWEQALRFNPDLFIPDMETLEDRVNTSASD
jgi:hypothetical protein